MIRLKFQKTGYLRFLSHLDVQRAFHRALIRTGLQVAFTEGFNPQVKMAFGPPLALGYESSSEYADLWLKESERASLLEVVKRLNDTLPQDLQVLEAKEYDKKPESLNSILHIGEYVITVSGEAIDWEKIILKEQTLITKKKTKAGIVDVDLMPYVKEIKNTDQGLSALLHLSCKPTLLLTALQEKGLVTEDVSFTTIHRINPMDL